MPETAPRPRGAIASPRHLLAAAAPHRPAAVPPQFAQLAPVLQMWGNDQYGDCVSAEEAAAKDQDGILITDHELIQWSGRHGWNNGATLTEVMDAMASEGITTAGKVYKDGPYQSVDWTDWTVVTSAIAAGQVKIGIAANQLEGHVGRANGWLMMGASKDRKIDHCTGLAGYGPLSFCCDRLGVSVPDGYDHATPCVIMFTWATYGIVSHKALIAICGEAWLRVPTTIGITPPTPTPPPVPDPWSWCHPAAKRAATHFLRGLRELVGIVTAIFLLLALAAASAAAQSPACPNCQTGLCPAQPLLTIPPRPAATQPPLQSASSACVCRVRANGTRHGLLRRVLQRPGCCR